MTTTPRAAALAGVVFALAFAASIVLLRTALPADPSADPAWADRGAGRIRAGLVLTPIAGIAFLWFVGVVRDQLGAVEDRFFATVVLGSGLLFLAMVFVTAALAGAILATAGAARTTGDEGDYVRFGRAVMLQVGNVYALRMAGVFMVSSGTLWLRTRTMPAWLVFLTWGLAAALLLTTSLSAWLPLVFPGWVLLVSLLLLFRARPPSTGKIIRPR